MLSLGLGLTNNCNLSCAHCYRDENSVAELSLDDVREIVETLPLRSVNLGTGENGLHSDFGAILDYLSGAVPKTTITSNGYSIAVLDDERLKKLANVEFSVDFPTEREQDGFRGRGNWRLVMEQTKRCQLLGVPVTVTAVMMSVNYDRLHEVAKVAAEMGANFRVNIYQPVQGDSFSLTYDQLWEGFRNLFAHTRLVTTTEPIVAAALGIEDFQGCGCGRTTVRVAPDGGVLPCVYLPETNLDKQDLINEGADIVQSECFTSFRRLPKDCQACELVSVCGGGCAGRRALYGAADEPDPYCPRRKNVQLPFQWADFHDLPKAGSACTTIVEYVDQSA
jgi:radical SAM protein with 4Fe4S-binding SPASM domain